MCQCQSVWSFWTHRPTVALAPLHLLACPLYTSTGFSIARAAELKCWKSTFLPVSWVLFALIDGPAAGGWRRAAGGLFAGLIGAVAVGWGVGDTRTAGRCGGTGGGLGFDLQPLVSQGLGEVVVHGHADGELLGAGLLVVHAEAPLEMLLDPVIVAALGNHWKGEGKRQSVKHTPQWLSESEWMWRWGSDRLEKELFLKSVRLTWCVAPVHLRSARGFS